MTGTPSTNQPWRDKDTLQTLYVDKGLSAVEIADKLGCGKRTVTNWLYKTSVKKPAGTKPYHDQDLLEDLYIKQDLSKEEISDNFNCAPITIERWLRRHRISKNRVDNTSDYPWRDPERLKELYCDLGLTNREAGEVMGCSHDCVHRWLNRHEIDIKNPRFRSWSLIKELRKSEDLSTEDLSEDTNVPVEIIERQHARFQQEVIENRPAPQHTAPGTDKPWHDEEKLEDLHHEKGLNPEEIGEKLGCNSSTARRWLITFGLMVIEDKAWTDPQVLESLHVEEGLNTVEIADELGCAKNTVRRWLQRHDLFREEKPPLWQFEGVLRTLYVEQEWSMQEIADELDGHKGTIRKWLKRHNIETRRLQGGPYEDEAVLRRLYLREEMSVTEIGEKFDCSHATISYWLARHGINTRTPDNVSHRILEREINDDVPPYARRELLQELFVEDEYGVSDIARELNCSEGVVRKHLDQFNIKKQKRVITAADIEYNIPEDTPWRDGELMEHLYLELELSIPKIQELLDCSSATVSNWLSNHDIETRRNYDRPSRLELKKLYVDKRRSGIQIANSLGVNRTTVYRWLREAGIQIREPSENTHPALRNGEKMREMYVDNEETITEIANKLSASKNTVSKSLERFKIEKRDWRDEISGPKNPFWKGGSKPYGEGWTNQKRRMVLERDDSMCQSCGMSQDTHRDETGQGLHIHHVIPASKFDNPRKRNDISNLIAMCSSCHRKWEGIPLKPDSSNR